MSFIRIGFVVGYRYISKVVHGEKVIYVLIVSFPYTAAGSKCFLSCWGCSVIAYGYELCRGGWGWPFACNMSVESAAFSLDELSDVFPC